MRFAARRLKSTAAFRAAQPVAPIVGGAVQPAIFPARHRFEIAAACAKNSSIGSHPEIARVVLEDLRNHVVVKPLMPGDGMEFSILMPAQSARRANPKHAPFVFKKGADKIAGQTVGAGEGLKFS